MQTDTPIPATDTPQPTDTASPIPATDIPIPAADTPIPATESPFSEAEATQTAPPVVQAIIENGGVLLQIIINSGSVNIRQAPNGIILGSLDFGTYAEVIGRHQDNSWVQIRLLDEEGEVWITTNPSLVEITGDIESLPITSEFKHLSPPRPYISMSPQ